LNSIRDLERTADYAVTATRYFVSNNDNISQDMRSLIGDTLHFAIITIKKIFNSINHKTAMEAYRVSQKSDLLFRKEYAKGLQRLSMILRNTNPDKIATLSQTAIIVLKHNERIVDHAINMAENFVFIKQKDFFLNKQNKQFNK
jgi:phosphate transport system protein